MTGIATAFYLGVHAFTQGNAGSGHQGTRAGIGISQKRTQNEIEIICPCVCLHVVFLTVDVLEIVALSSESLIEAILSLE